MGAYFVPGPLAIRAEHTNDKAQVYEVVGRAFGQENEAKLVDLLRESDAFVPELSLVVVAGEEILRYILFTRIKIIDEGGDGVDSLALAPLAIKPEHQNQGIGGELIEAGLTRAKVLNFRSVIVLGHAHYYPKFGFEPTIKWNIEAPCEKVAVNNYMGLELFENGLQNVNGTVQYAKEFKMV
jgi:predicted N-acetyltransferase YhbS